MQTFVAAVESGSFTAAADRLGLSKKLVSRYLAELEGHLGARLLHRTTRRHSLTAAGQRYYRRCLEILEAVEAAESEVNAEARGFAGTIRVAAPTIFGEIYVLPVLTRFRALHPGLSIDLRLSDHYVDLAAAGFDLALRIGSLEDSAHRARQLGDTALWTVAAPGYLAVNGTPATPAELGAHRCLHDSNMRSGTVWVFGTGEQTSRVRIEADFTVDSARAIADLAIAGHGIARCPDFVAAPEVRAGRLTRVLTEFTPEPYAIQALYLRNAYLPARVRAFIDFLAGAFAERSW